MIYSKLFELRLKNGKNWIYDLKYNEYVIQADTQAELESIVFEYDLDCSERELNNEV